MKEKISAILAGTCFFAMAVGWMYALFTIIGGV